MYIISHKYVILNLIYFFQKLNYFKKDIIYCIRKNLKH